MSPLHKSNNPHHSDSADNPKKNRNSSGRLRTSVRLFAGACSRFLTPRVIGIATSVAVATILLTVITVTGVTQKRIGPEGQTVASNGTSQPNSGSGTNSSAPMQAGGPPQDRPVPSLGQRV